MVDLCGRTRIKAVRRASLLYCLTAVVLVLLLVFFFTKTSFANFNRRTFIIIETEDHYQDTVHCGMNVLLVLSASWCDRCAVDEAAVNSIVRLIRKDSRLDRSVVVAMATVQPRMVGGAIARKYGVTSYPTVVWVPNKLLDPVVLLPSLKLEEVLTFAREHI